MKWRVELKSLELAYHTSSCAVRRCPKHPQVDTSPDQLLLANYKQTLPVDDMQLLTAFAGFVALATIGNCQITKVNDFNAGPTKLGMYVHVPKNLKSPAPIVVAVHHCQGSAQGYSTETRYMPLSDQRGFILIYPNSRSSGGCFDVASTASMSSPLICHIFMIMATIKELLTRLIQV
jgi:hypothetical protein